MQMWIVFGAFIFVYLSIYKVFFLLRAIIIINQFITTVAIKDTDVYFWLSYFMQKKLNGVVFMIMVQRIKYANAYSFIWHTDSK